MTHYMQSKQAWITFPKELTRAETIFSAFGAAWVTMTETLTKAGTFSETSYPSVRRTMNATLTLGNEINERAGKIIHDWPAKLLAVYLNIDYIGDKKKKKPQNKGAEDGVSKKQSKKKKKDDAYSDDEEEVAKKKKHHHHHHSHANGKPVIEEPRDPWEFRDLVDVLKADRKRIGGVEFDLTMMTEDLRKLAVAAI
ncbi:hypothetical protein HDU79_004476 [Rhizoclosmatium sp. JEL0117]|nr:hypothetical protein HDU79_004476 [Rhizoclosmatium sp. JEL0117]